MATGGEVGGSREQRSDVVHDYTCSTCSKSDQTTEASHYCPECDVCYCKLCMCDHTVLGRSDIEQWDKAAGTAEKKAGDKPEYDTLKCLRHPQYDIALYCEDHDVVCCRLCPYTEHRSCGKLKQVAVAAKEINIYDVIPTIRAGMQELCRKAERLGNNKAQIRLTELSHGNYVRQLREIKAELDSKFKQIEDDADRNNQHYHETFRVECVLSREVIDGLAKLRNALEPSPEKNTHFIAVKLAGQWTAENNKQLSDILDNELKIVVHRMAKEIAPSIQELVTKAEKLKVSGLQVQLTVRSSKDAKPCKIVGICQIENGNIVLADNHNRRLKQLDGNYTVINDLELQGAPSDLCAAGDGEVVVAMEYNKVLIADVGAEFKVVRYIEMTHTCSYVTYHNGVVYIVSNYPKCINVYAKRNGAMTILTTIPPRYSRPQYSHTANDIQTGRVCAIVNGHTHGLCIGGERLTSYDLDGKKVTVSGDVSNVLGLCVDNEGYMYVTQKGSIIKFSVSIIKFQSKLYLQKIKTIALPFDDAWGPICYDKNTKCIVTCSQNRDYVYLVHTGYHGDNS